MHNDNESHPAPEGDVIQQEQQQQVTQPAATQQESVQHAATETTTPQCPSPIEQLSNCQLMLHTKDKCVWQCEEFCGRPCIIKQSQQQACRHPLLDRKVTKQPCQLDVAGMCRARKLGVATPVPYHLDLQHNLVYLSRVEGCTLWQRLSDAQEGDTGVTQLMHDLGRLLALLHDGGVAHGALSTHCVLVRHEDQALDFERFLNTSIPRDKAADLVVLEAQLKESHPSLPDLFDVLIKSYNKHSKQWSAVFNRLPEARALLQKQGLPGGSKKKRRTY